jgi:4'-phosphopantetheinyl transferase
VTTSALPPHVVSVFYVRTAELAPSHLLEYETLLSTEERARWLRFIPADSRLQFLVARALLRTTLSRFDATPPAAWVFRMNAWGRPEIATDAGAHRLRFNLSHATGLVACIVASGREVGVDTEETARGGSLLDIADRYFAPAEVAALRALPEELRRDRFFDYWTLKESYIKARGLGLSLSLQEFSFDLERAPAIGFRAERAIDADDRRWQFELWSPTPHHRLAACFERTAGEAVDVQLRAVVPPIPGGR